MSDELAREHAELRHQAARGRQAFQKSPGARLGPAVMEAVDLAAKMKADGASDAERFAVIEATIREFWPQSRVWRYLCERCRDLGLVIHENVTNRLGVQVDEGMPCDCAKGDRFKPKKPADMDFTEAGKVKKPPSFTRFGR